MPIARVRCATIGNFISRSGCVNAPMKGITAPRLAISASALTAVRTMTNLNCRRLLYTKMNPKATQKRTAGPGLQIDVRHVSVRCRWRMPLKGSAHQGNQRSQDAAYEQPRSHHERAPRTVANFRRHSRIHNREGIFGAAMGQHEVLGFGLDQAIDGVLYLDDIGICKLLVQIFDVAGRNIDGAVPKQVVRQPHETVGPRAATAGSVQSMVIVVVPFNFSSCRSNTFFRKRSVAYQTESLFLELPLIKGERL